MGALEPYRRKRRFEETPEPRPVLEVVPRTRRAGNRFCVQEHHASHLHYDLRLEMDGVLKSWAVPKGPSLDPEVRRLAMAVEDHPLDYLTFEGRIPEGNYGAGEVIVWDLGDYEPVGELPPVEQWERGHLKFRLQGKKLQGEFALIHIASRDEKRQNQWLLTKKADDAAAYGDDAAQHPGSVLPHHRRRRAAAERPGPRLVAPAAVAGVPAEPMLATLGKEPFNDPDWRFEIKWDGIRAFARCRRGAVTLISRNGRDLTRQYPELARFSDPAANAALDGEIVTLDRQGRSSFHRLQQRMNLAGERDIARAATKFPVVYYAFDLLSLGRRDLKPRPLAERKAQLAKLDWRDPWRYADDVAGDGVGLFRQAQAHGLEGIVAKRADAPYQPGRSRQWLKFKIHRRQEVVIVGYTDPQGSRTDFGALLIAVYDPDRKAFVPAGKVGTGFDAATRAAILRRLHPLGPARGGLHPVKPELVAEVKFAEWTPDGSMRAPVFLGLRSDKSPIECVREVPRG